MAKVEKTGVATAANVPKNEMPLLSSQSTTNRIALGLLFAFVGSILLAFIVNGVILFYCANCDIDPELAKEWIDILKNSLVLLGTALTSVIGFYFGQRNATTEAESKIKERELVTDRIVSTAINGSYEEAYKILKSEDSGNKSGEISF